MFWKASGGFKQSLSRHLRFWKLSKNCPITFREDSENQIQLRCTASSLQDLYRQDDWGRRSSRSELNMLSGRLPTRKSCFVFVFALVLHASGRATRRAEERATLGEVIYPDEAGLNSLCAGVLLGYKFALPHGVKAIDQHPELLQLAKQFKPIFLDLEIKPLLEAFKDTCLKATDAEEAVAHLGFGDE